VTLHFVQGLLLTAAHRMAGVRDITALMERGLLQHTIAARFQLARIADAHAAAESGAHIGKVIVATA
jgi:NADPH:quinone reductase-like Zn-dependent oxidoreductase